MEIRNEPNLRQEWSLSQIVIVSSIFVVVIAAAIFLFNNLYPSAPASAAGKNGTLFELNGSIEDKSVQEVFSKVGDGDTLVITEKFVITKEFKDLYDKNIVILVNGYLVWTIEYPLYLGKEAKVIFGEKGEIVNEGKTCTETTSIQFDGNKIASCNGSDAKYSFEEVMKSGGVNINGLLTKQKTFNLTGTTTDKENVVAFNEAQDGDTIKLSGKFLVTDHFKDLADKKVIIVVEDGLLIWEKEYNVYLNKESKVLLGNNGSLYTGNCEDQMMLFIGDAEMGSCNGKLAKYSFEEINKVGGISYEGLTALPVELIKFEALLNNEKVDLLWATASEVNNKEFEIEKSENGADWTKIGKVVGKGNSQDIVNYKFTDAQPANVNVIYYRLKQIDFDGKFEYSFVRSINLKGTIEKISSVYPNPANQFINVKVEKGDNFNITIVSQAGQIKLNQVMSAPVETIDLSTFTNGIYFVNIEKGSIKETHKVIVKH